MESLGIYISVPFCRSKCTYCNFASGVFPERIPRAVYRSRGRGCRNSRGFVWQASGASSRRLLTAFISVAEHPAFLLPSCCDDSLRPSGRSSRCQRTPKITLECAPGQLDDGFLAAMVECGVNRVSFGVQSFIDREAAVTGRLHTREIALRDIDRVRKAGIRSVNADLIAGLPHQTAESWRESLDVLISSGVDHASIYMLEVDEDSRLGRELIGGGGRYHAGAVPTDEMVADFYLEAIEILIASGLAQYEISNFARAGAASRHNMKYWLRQPYLGFGLDAHSMLRTADDGAVRFQDWRRSSDLPGWCRLGRCSACFSASGTGRGVVPGVAAE